MPKEESTGYLGEAHQTLKSVKAKIGDRIRVTTTENIFEGIVIPRAEIGADDQHIIIKLDSGYNIGIHVDNIQQIKRLALGKKAKPELPPIARKTKKGLPWVSILSTGGTIASRVDYQTGAVNPALTADDLYTVVPELGDLANIRAEVLFSVFSENLLPSHWTTMAKQIAKHLNESEGVVIAHGTDTLAYTAAALSFALQNLPGPVILTGSQRSSDRPSSDAALNLTAAVITAVQGPIAEVVVAMHRYPDDTSVALYPGTQVRKCHTSRRDAFKPINADLIGEVRDGHVRILVDKSSYHPRDKTRQLRLQPKFDPKVALVKTTPGLMGDRIDTLIDKGYHGIVIEGTGLGHAPKAIFDAIERARVEKIPVVMTSQCIWGRVQMRVYRTGVELVQRGVIPGEDMIAETAYVKLMWVLAQTQDPVEVQKRMLLSVAGEVTECSKRSQYEELSSE
jgi:glutamyl-tRNA(Gln) amidotransferase subunit D